VVTSELFLGGFVPRAINDAITVPKLSATPLHMIQYFSDVRSPEAHTTASSRELGKLTFLQLNPVRKRPEELRAATSLLIARNDALRACQAKYNFLHDILCTVARNSITATGSSNVMSAALVLTGSEATRITNTFSLLLLSNMTGDAAVDEWFHAFPALRDLDEEFLWLRPMMEGVAAALLSETPFGVKLRAYSGAAFSMLDMVTDVYVICDMFAAEKKEIATALLAMICANILLQLLFVWIQNRRIKRKNNGWMMLRECLYVVTCVKPGVEAKRIASGQKDLPGSIVSPLQEMSYCRGIELFCEAAPGMVLQSAAYLASKERTNAALGSILISAGCAAMTAASLAYDIDVSPEKRKTSPDVCGMIPDTGRGLAFFVMFSISFLQLTAKCVSVALLAATNPIWLACYLGGDMTIYLIQKIIRGDLIYHIAMPPAVAVPLSVQNRVITKAISDFTGSMLLRAPNELGGVYFSFNLASGIISVPVISYLYTQYAVVNEDGGARKLSARMLWTFSVCIVLSWAVMFGYFMTRIIVPRYRKTFWSTQTGWQRSERIFLDNEEDEERALVFRKSIILWSRIKEDVRSWTMGSWEAWDREKPEWFTDKFVSSVPDEFIPPRFLTKLGGDVRKRRGSAAVSIREVMEGE
jgi:hypothetical protein